MGLGVLFGMARIKLFYKKLANSQVDSCKGRNGATNQLMVLFDNMLMTTSSCYVSYDIHHKHEIIWARIAIQNMN